MSGWSLHVDRAAGASGSILCDPKAQSSSYKPLSVSAVASLCLGDSRVRRLSLLSFLYSAPLCDHGTSMKTVLHVNEVFFSCNHGLGSKRTFNKATNNGNAFVFLFFFNSFLILRLVLNFRSLSLLFPPSVSDAGPVTQCLLCASLY